MNENIEYQKTQNPSEPAGSQPQPEPAPEQVHACRKDASLQEGTDTKGSQAKGKNEKATVIGESDTIQLIVHTLGYYPENSTVFLALSDNQVGPIMRMNPRREIDSTVDYLHLATSMLPTRCHDGSRVNSFMMVHFGPVSPVYVPALEEDHPQVRELASFFDTIFDRSVTNDLACILCIAVADNAYAVLDEQGKVAISEPLAASRYDMQQLLDVPAPDTDSTSHWNKILVDPRLSNEPENTRDWYSACSLWDMTYAQEYARVYEGRRVPYSSYSAQRATELCYWDAAIEAVSRLLAPYRKDKDRVLGRWEEIGAELGDSMRLVLPPEIIAYLLNTLDYASVEPIMYTAARSLPAALDYLTTQEQGLKQTLEETIKDYEQAGIELPADAPRLEDFKEHEPGENIWNEWEENLDLIEPVNYGSALSHRDRIMPETFRHSFAAVAAPMPAVGHQRVRWMDWVARTHRRAQKWAADIAARPASSPKNRVEHNALELVYALSGRSCRPAPAWKRIEAFEALLSLMLPMAEGEGLSGLLQAQAWINWLKGNGQLAHTLACCSLVVCPEESVTAHILRNEFSAEVARDKDRRYKGHLHLSAVDGKDPRVNWGV